MPAIADSVVRLAENATGLVADNALWMGWNLFLALLPLYLAARLFRHPGFRIGTFWWWVGAAAWLAFLPNAPYVLTDLLHLSGDVSRAPSNWQAIFVVVPMYLAFCAIGFEAYVVSLIWLGRLLRQRGWSAPSTIGVEFSLHLLCAIGVYVGRFVRLNTWDVVARPHFVAGTLYDTFTHFSPLAFIAVFFVATSALYWPAKHLTIAAVVYVRSGTIRRAHLAVEQHL